MKFGSTILAKMRNAVPANLLEAGQQVTVGRRLPREADAPVEGGARDRALAAAKAKPLLVGLAAAGLTAAVLASVARAKRSGGLQLVAEFDHQVTGVAVTADGRQPLFASDGIAISNDGGTLFYQALTGSTLYSIDTALLLDDVPEPQRAARVKTVARTHVADGLWMSKAGILYLTSPSDYSIKRLNGSSVETVLTDRRLRWPDTFSEGPDGRMYVTASHIQDTEWFTRGAAPSIRTQLFSFPPVR